MSTGGKGFRKHLVNETQTQSFQQQLRVEHAANVGEVAMGMVK